MRKNVLISNSAIAFYALGALFVGKHVVQGFFLPKENPSTNHINLVTPQNPGSNTDGQLPLIMEVQENNEPLLTPDRLDKLIEIGGTIAFVIGGIYARYRGDDNMGTPNHIYGRNYDEQINFDNDDIDIL